MQFANFPSNHAFSSVTSILKMKNIDPKMTWRLFEVLSDRTLGKTPHSICCTVASTSLTAPGSSNSSNLLKQFTEANLIQINPKTGRLRAERHLNHTVPVAESTSFWHKNHQIGSWLSWFMQCIFFSTICSTLICLSNYVATDPCLEGHPFSFTVSATVAENSSCSSSPLDCFNIGDATMLTMSIWDSYTGPGHIIASILWMGRCIIVILQGDRLCSCFFFTFMCLNYVSVAFLHPRLVHGS